MNYFKNLFYKASHKYQYEPKQKIGSLIQDVISWGENKGICKPENARNQLLKILEEKAEISEHELSGSLADLIDSVGDFLVTNILYFHIKGFDIQYVIEQSQNGFKPMAWEVKQDRAKTCICIMDKHLGKIASCELKGKKNYYFTTHLELSLRALYVFCEIKGINVNYALSEALDVISKRSGKMVNGSFIKEEDLLNVQAK